MRRTVAPSARDLVRDGIVAVLAVACALARALPFVYFPTVILQGKGPVFLHYPIIGLAIAALVGARRPFRSMLLFGLVHLGAVLAFEWRAGVYDFVLGQAMGSPTRAYLVAGNAYIVVALIAVVIGAALLITGRRFRVPVVADWWILIGLFLLSFVSRWWWAHHVLATGQYLVASDDGLTYHALARGIATGTLPRPDDFYGFGGTLYWFFLAGIYRVAGLDNFSAVILIQTLMGALLPVATYLIARMVIGSQPMAVVAGLLVALNRIMIFLSGVMGMEALYLPLVYVGLVWLLARPRRPWAYIGIGLILGLANLARNEIFLFPFLLLALTFVFARGDRAALKAMALVCVGFLLIRAGEMALLYTYYGRLTMPAGQAAITFSLKWYGLEHNHILDSMGFNPFRDVSKSLVVWRTHFGEVNRLLAVGFVKRLVLFLTMPGDGLFDPLTITDSDFIHNYFPAVRVSYPALLDSYSLLFCLIGLVALGQYRRDRVWPLWTLVIYITLLNAAIIAKNPRHRAILIPIFVLGAVQGVAWLLQRVERENDRAAAPSI